jgi:hypothetical protein
MSANLCSGVYFIRSEASGTVVHVNGSGSILVGSALDYDRAGTQLFEFKRWGNRFVITNIGTKLVIDMCEGDASPRTAVLSCTFHGGPNQQWYIRREGDGNRSFYFSRCWRTANSYLPAHII